MSRRRWEQRLLPSLAVCTLFFFLPSFQLRDVRLFFFLFFFEWRANWRQKVNVRPSTPEGWELATLVASGSTHSTHLPQSDGAVWASKLSPNGVWTKMKSSIFQFCSYFSFFLVLCQSPPAVSIYPSCIVYNAPLAIIVLLVWKEKLGAEQTGYVFTLEWNLAKMEVWDFGLDVNSRKEHSGGKDNLVLDMIFFFYHKEYKYTHAHTYEIPVTIEFAQKSFTRKSFIHCGSVHCDSVHCECCGDECRRWRLCARTL